jgi:hypothetical protein
MEEIQRGNTSKSQRLDQTMAALAKVWATMFVWRLTNFTTKFEFKDKIFLILQMIELNSELPTRKLW